MRQEGYVTLISDFPILMVAHIQFTKAKGLRSASARVTTLKRTKRQTSVPRRKTDTPRVDTKGS